MTKQKSKLRVSFNPDNEDNDSSAVPSESEPSVVRPPKRGISNSLQDRLKQASLREDDIRPSYSKSALDELRNSTPSTPKDLSLTTTPDPEEARSLDVAAKFGPSKTSSSSAIPSATEIAERKARRARLALEQTALPASTTDPNSEDYIPLDAYDSDGEFKPSRMQIGTWHAPAKEPESRLQHEDEDIAEGFDTFVSDNHDPRGRITTDSLNLTSKSARHNAAAQREAMRARIDAAEASDDDSDASGDGSGYDSDDAARHHAYELAQTAYGLPSAGNSRYLQAQKRPKQPKETTPIVKLSAGLQGLRDRVTAIGVEKGRLERRLTEIAQEREDVRKRQDHIQKSLQESAAELERVQTAEAASEPQSNGGAHVAGTVNGGSTFNEPHGGHRGLDNIGSGMSRPPADEYDD